MKPEIECPASQVLFDYCDHANDFNATKNKKGKEKQNDEWWWEANQRTEKFVDRGIKLSWGKQKIQGKLVLKTQQRKECRKHVS